MSYERLPDEILLMICSYLSRYDTIKAFNDLNTRLNCTINEYRANLDFRGLSLREFHFFCKSIRSSFGGEVHSLILSNAAPSVRQLILFRKQIPSFGEVLPNLERLILIDHYDDELDLYLPLISILTNLKELKICFIKTKNQTTLCTFIPQMLTDNFLYFDHRPKRRKRQSLTLTNLSLTGTVENTDDLLVIFSGFTSLQYLNVNIKQLTPTPCDARCRTRELQCLSLIDFRCQVRWKAEKLSFDEFTRIISGIPNLQYLSCTLMTTTNQEKLLHSDYNDIEKWRSFSREFANLAHLDCSIKCPLKASICLESDVIRIIANISRTSDRSIDIQLHNQTSSPTKHDATLELDIQELPKISASQLVEKLLCSQELTLYSDFFLDDEKIFSTFPDSLLFSDDLIFSHLRSFDLLGEFPHLNNIFLMKFIEQLIHRSPHLQSIGFFLYWVENMTEIVLNFLRPLKNDLKHIKKCYLYTEGDVNQKFVSELASLLPSLTFLSLKIDWYCHTADIVNLILVHMKNLNHLELVLEDIPDYLDEDSIDRIRIEKEIESLAMTRDTREWLKRNTILGTRSFNQIFQAEKNGDDLKIWL